MNFTLLNNTELNNLIQKDLDTCTRILKNAFGDNLISLLLIGGYGRAEGGTDKTPQGLRPKNNYDLLCVLKSQNFWERKKNLTILENIKKNANHLINIPLEVSIITKKNLSKPNPIMIFQDIYNSSILLFGESPRNYMDKSVQNLLPKSEALNIIRNRGMLLFSCLNNMEHLGYKTELKQLKIWIAKTIIGFGDAVLILEGNYKTSYYDKMTAIQKLDFSSYFKDKELYQVFKKYHKIASEFRLYGSEINYDTTKKEVIPALEEIHLETLRQNQKSSLISWEDYSHKLNFPKYGFIQKIKNLIREARYFKTLKISKPFTNPVDKLSAILPLLLYSEKSIKKCHMELFNLPEKAGVKPLKKTAMNLYIDLLV